MPDAHKNLAVSAVATAPSPATSGTSLVVTAGQGTRFPTAPFNATIWPTGTVPDPTNAEIVRVTVVSTDTLTITRAQESTSARTVIVGDLIAATITAKTLTDVETNPTIGGSITLSQAASEIIPGATSLTFRNTADSADNLSITNAGVVTIRAGLTITAGGLTVTAGNVGIGAANQTFIGIYMPAATVLTGSTQQHGLLITPTADSGATSQMNGIRVIPQTAAAAFTAAAVAGLSVGSPGKGAGSTITSAYGLLVDAITSGNTDNFGVDIATPSGGSGLNLSLRASGAVRFSGLGARVAGDLYVIIDSSGNLHKSAIGPAS